MKKFFTLFFAVLLYTIPAHAGPIPKVIVPTINAGATQFVNYTGRADTLVRSDWMALGGDTTEIFVTVSGQNGAASFENWSSTFPNLSGTYSVYHADSRTKPPVLLKTGVTNFKEWFIAFGGFIYVEWTRALNAINVSITAR